MSPLTIAIYLFQFAMMVFAISVHDMAQAWMANRRGDPTARMLGRMTLNPVAHFDPWGMALLPIVSMLLFQSSFPFGWGAPVPMTTRNFRSRGDENAAILAGSTAQLLTAALALLVLIVLKHTVPDAARSLEDVVSLALAHEPISNLSDLPAIFPVLLLLYLCIMMNLLLSTLNLLPMPFLDGGKVLVNYLPYNAARAYERLQTVLTIAFFFLAYPLTIIAFKPLLIFFTAVLDRF